MRVRPFCLAAAAAIGVHAPATADTGTFYVGLEAGPAFGRDSDVDEVVDPAGPGAATEYDDVLSAGYRPGHDFGISGGHDFGALRVELEVARKQAPLKSVEPDENFENFMESVPGLTEGDLDLRSKTTTVSAMLNGLIDVGVTDGLALYGGGGYGRSWVRSVGDEDSSWAWQWIVGVRFAVSEDVEIGLKQRYFNSGIVRLRHRPPTHAGNAAIMPEIEGEHRIRSMLLSLHFKL